MCYGLLLTNHDLCINVDSPNVHICLIMHFEVLLQDISNEAFLSTVGFYFETACWHVWLCSPCRPQPPALPHQRGGGHTLPDGGRDHRHDVAPGALHGPGGDGLPPGDGRRHGPGPPAQPGSHRRVQRAAAAEGRARLRPGATTRQVRAPRAVRAPPLSRRRRLGRLGEGGCLVTFQVGSCLCVSAAAEDPIASIRAFLLLRALNLWAEWRVRWRGKACWVEGSLLTTTRLLQCLSTDLHSVYTVYSPPLSDSSTVRLEWPFSVCRDCVSLLLLLFWCFFLLFLKNPLFRSREFFSWVSQSRSTCSLVLLLVAPSLTSTLHSVTQTVLQVRFTSPLLIFSVQTGIDAPLPFCLWLPALLWTPQSASPGGGEGLWWWVKHRYLFSAW